MGIIDRYYIRDSVFRLVDMDVLMVISMLVRTVVSWLMGFTS